MGMLETVLILGVVGVGGYYLFFMGGIDEVQGALAGAGDMFKLPAQTQTQTNTGASIGGITSGNNDAAGQQVAIKNIMDLRDVSKEEATRQYANYLTQVKARNASFATGMGGKFRTQAKFSI